MLTVTGSEQVRVTDRGHVSVLLGYGGISPVFALEDWRPGMALPVLALAFTLSLKSSHRPFLSSGAQNRSDGKLALAFTLSLKSSHRPFLSSACRCTKSKDHRLRVGNACRILTSS